MVRRGVWCDFLLCVSGAFPMSVVGLCQVCCFAWVPVSSQCSSVLCVCCGPTSGFLGLGTCGLRGVVCKLQSNRADSRHNRNESFFRKTTFQALRPSKKPHSNHAAVVGRTFLCLEGAFGWFEEGFLCQEEGFLRLEDCLWHRKSVFAAAGFPES